MKTSIPKLSSVKFRSGASIHVLRNRRPEECVRAYDRLASGIRARRADDMTGFAIVAWSDRGSVSTTLHIEDGRQVGTMMAPEFVKNAILDHIASGD